MDPELITSQAPDPVADGPETTEAHQTRCIVVNLFALAIAGGLAACPDALVHAPYVFDTAEALYEESKARGLLPEAL